MLNLPEKLKIILCGQAAANGLACDVISMKNFLKGWFLIVHTGANDTDLTLTLMEATDVAAGTNQAVAAAKAVPIWRDDDAGTTSDVLTQGTDGVALTIDPLTQNGVVALMEVDPSILSDGYDCVYLADAGGNAGNIVTVLFLGVPRYAGATLPAGITD